MKVISLQQHYEALSYECTPDVSAAGTERLSKMMFNGEDPTAAKQIYVNDYRVEVSWTLHSALWHIRNSSPPGLYSRTLWIDALSINQHDRKEKDHEIRRMREIYSNCKWVLVWLGESIELSDQVIEFFDNFFSQSSHDTAEGLERELLATSFINPFMWQCFGDGLLRRSYWTRLWTVQEIALAPKALLMCGEKKMRWENFVLVLGMALKGRINIHRPPIVIPSITSPSGVREGINPRITLWNMVQNGTYPEISDLVIKLGSLQTTDPRDRVNALLGLARNGRHERLKPDSDREVEESYADFSRFLLSEYRQLDVLFTRRGVMRRGFPDFPTWALDLTDDTDQCRYPQILGPFGAKPTFDAAAGSEHRDLPTYHLGEIIVEGFYIDDVERVGELPVPVHGNGLETLTLFADYEAKEWEAKWIAYGTYDQNLLAVESSKPYPLTNNVSKNTALSQTLVYGMSWRMERCMPFEGYLDIPKTAPRDFCPDMEPRLRAEAWSAESWNWRTCFWNGRRFAKTKYAGGYCLMPRDTKEGDEIFVLRGATEPVVLRHSKTDLDTYFFVGAW